MRQVLPVLIAVLLLSSVHSLANRTYSDATTASAETVNFGPNEEPDIFDMALEAKNFIRTVKRPSISFDKPVYYPDVEVFWNQNASLLPMKITVTDKYIGSVFIQVKILSSLDARKLNLTKIALGRFEGSVQAKCLLDRESFSDQTVFKVRYGDRIIAKYTDHIQATAFVAFPKYVLDKEFTSLNPWKLFDSEGVPIVNYGQPIGVQYNPVTVSQYALANYYVYVTTGNSTCRERFLVQANWLVRNAEHKGNFSVWEYRFNLPAYKATDPWVSAMAQGQGLSVLARAYVLTGNATYLDVAETALRSFEVEMNYGGVRFADAGDVWYEEVADAGAPSSKVLNGFIFALFGLYEYSFVTNSSKGYALFWEGVHTLSLNLYRYDSGSWSYYDLLYQRPASSGYHKLHIDQLMTLYELTDDEVFEEYSYIFYYYIHPRFLNPV